MTAAEQLKDLGRQEGKREGWQEGKQEGVKTVAQTMLLEGAEAAFVAKMTGLPIADIERLRASLNSKA